MASSGTVQSHRGDPAELTTVLAVTTNSGADAVGTARLMQARQVERLPAVDEDGRLAGIVSRADVFSVFEHADARSATRWSPASSPGSSSLTRAFDVMVASGIVTVGGQVDQCTAAP
jgi:CBS-domain-containing membrane protein